MTLEELVAALGKAKVYPALVNAAPAIALAIHNVLSPYPPSGPGNQPRAWTRGGRNSWYERGYGSRWVVRSGAIHGRATSETLGRRWHIHRTPTGALLSNNASYAGRVQGARQAARFKKIGWVTVPTAIDAAVASGVVGKIIAQALAHAFRQAGSGT